MLKAVLEQIKWSLVPERLSFNVCTKHLKKSKQNAPSDV